jgi:hypothetical protein
LKLGELSARRTAGNDNWWNAVCCSRLVSLLLLIWKLLASG